jgi:hypothetical protein
MKIVVLYRPNSEHSRLVDDFIRDFQRNHESQHIEVLSLDTREGSATATLYDIVQYPAIMIMKTDGAIQKVWQGDTLPLMDEVAAYATA